VKIVVKVIAGLLFLFALALAGLYVTGRGEFLILAVGLAVGAPGEPFIAGETVAPPDYTNDAYWAALPGADDLSDLVPKGINNPELTGTLPVDVFFIHPTGLMNGLSWVSNLQTTSKTEENTLWMLVNQASAYNGCCQVYAPRYREANIFTYSAANGTEFKKIMRFAYNDVLAAFENFLIHRNRDRPFIIASHSQGSHHGIVLLRERIDGTSLVDRMVAAYLIGGNLSRSEFSGLKDILLCDSPTQLHCVIHYDTMSEHAKVQPERADNVCVNPLSWRLDGESMSKSHHKGAVIPVGHFQLDFFSDKFTGVKFPPLDAPLPNHVTARCGDGVLYVTDQQDTLFDGLTPAQHNYHLLDYPLFYMDIRTNAILRTQSYLNAQ
jgi:hypothetical protein